MANKVIRDNEILLNKIVQLDDIATIRMGYSSKGRQFARPQVDKNISDDNLEELERKGMIPFINVKDIREGEPINPHKLAVLEDKWLDGRTMRLRPDDIVFLAHGERFRAAVIPSNIPASICSAYFYAISINAGNILPDYVCWYLNRPKTMNYLTKISVGSDIKFIPRQEIKNFPLPIPNIDIQRRIVNIEEKRAEENRIMDELKQKRNVLVDAMLNNIIDNPCKYYE